MKIGIDALRKKYYEYVEEYKKEDYEFEKIEIYKKERKDFVTEYSLEKLENLKLEEYINITDRNNPDSVNTLLYKIEYGKYAAPPRIKGNKNNGEEKYYTSRKEYVSIGNPKISGNVSKSLIYIDKEKEKYKIDTTILENDEAKKIWIKIRKLMVDFIKSLEKVEKVEDIKFEDYFSKANLNRVLGKEYFKKEPPDRFKVVVLYLATQFYPEKFIGIGIKDEINKVIEDLEIKDGNNIIEKSFVLNKYLRENIKNTDKYDSKILFDAVKDTYNLFWKDRTTVQNVPENPLNINKIDSPDRKDEDKKQYQNLIGKNIIFYGAPGCGKSYQVSEIVKEYLKEKNYDRILFHPEYTYSDFVGQIVPTINKDKKTLSYEFKPGPFTKILYKALINPKEEYCLIIEEINRGNAAAIFGDIFQLLDRIKKETEENYSIGDSEYPIKNDLIFDYLVEQEKDIEKVKNILKGTEKIYIPHNLTILATMNSNDQNVFVLDTAFKRRWDFKYIKNNFDNKDNEAFFETLIPTNGTSITWKEFACELNKKIPELNNGINGDDKLIGPYFVSEEDLKNAENFAHKIFLYLWNDVAKMNKKDLFKEEFTSLEKLIDEYCKNGIEVFNEKIFSSDENEQYMKEENKDE